MQDQASNISSASNRSFNSSINVYIDGVYVSLAALPATLLGIVTVNLLGGKIMLGELVKGKWSGVHGMSSIGRIIGYRKLGTRKLNYDA